MMANMNTLVQQSLTHGGVMEDKRTNLVRAEVQVRQQHFAKKKYLAILHKFAKLSIIFTHELVQERGPLLQQEEEIVETQSSMKVN